MSEQTEGTEEDREANESRGEPRPQREGWVRISDDRRPLLLVALACAALLVVGGLGPWAKFGPFTGAGTDGDGWFLIGAGILAGLLIVRLNSREGRVDRLAWLIPVAGAIGAIVGLIDLVELLNTELISVGWGLWIGIAAGVTLSGVSVRMLAPHPRAPLAAILAALAVSGAGVGIGLAASDGDAESSPKAWNEDDLWSEDADDEPAKEATAADDESVLAESDEEIADEYSNDPTESPEGEDCDALGINPEQRHEGTCVTDGQTFTVVNRGSTLTLDELNARLLGIEKAKTVTGEYMEPETADGTFVIVELEVKNKTNSPASFDSLGDQVALLLDGNLFTEDTEAASVLDRSFWSLSKDIQPQSTQAGVAVFDVPTRFLRELEQGGNLAILNFSEIRGFDDFENLDVIGIIRTSSRRD